MPFLKLDLNPEALQPNCAFKNESRRASLETATHTHIRVHISLPEGCKSLIPYTAPRTTTGDGGRKKVRRTLLATAPRHMCASEFALLFYLFAAVSTTIQPPPAPHVTKRAIPRARIPPQSARRLLMQPRAIKTHTQCPKKCNKISFRFPVLFEGEGVG